MALDKVLKRYQNLKMEKSEREFFAKILLFGEYGVICNSMGLSIPYLEFKGKLTFFNEKSGVSAEFAQKSNKSIRQFFKYLSNLAEKNELKTRLNFEEFSKELDRNIFFDSNIPQGFGIGSSGALVAAIYDRYAIDKIPAEKKHTKRELRKLKDIFAQMESFFHGKSSGLDPINCYLNKPLLIENISTISEIGLNKIATEEKSGIFLIDTGTVGNTGPLVNYFLEQCKDDKFYSSLQQEMIPANNKCIKSYIKGELYDFYVHVKALSKFLLHHFGPMIPDPFIEVWKKGLETSAYYLKLCGSGGGGYLLGFARDLEYAKEELEKLQVKIIPVAVTSK